MGKAVVYPNCIRLAGPVFFAYDVFVTTGKLVLIGPLEVKLFSRFEIDIKRVFVLHNGQKINGTVVPDKHGHTLIIEFRSPVFAHLPPNEAISATLVVSENRQAKLSVKSHPNRPFGLCLTTLQRNETFLLEPWINYHLSLGVDHFFIYDNNSDEFDAIEKILSPYIELNIVTLISWPFPKRMRESGISGQTAQQNHCLYSNSNVDWLGMTDVDEFLVPKRANELKSVLQPYQYRWLEIGAVSIQSAWFGCNNQIEFTQSDFLSRLSMRKREYEPRHQRQKTIAVPANVKMYSIHQVVEGKKTIYIEPDAIGINHYYIFSRRVCEHGLFDQVVDNRAAQLVEQHGIPLVREKSVPEFVQPGPER